MKAAQLAKTMILLSALAVGLLSAGCSNNSPAMMSTDETVDGRTIKFIPLVDMGSNSLQKATTTQKWVSKWSGGTLHMHHIANSGSPRAEVIVDLVILPMTMDYSKNVTITFDDEDNIGEADLVFGPHGTQFSLPALMTIECKNFNLNGINPDDLRFYYLNENGQWEEHETHEIFVDVLSGTIRVVGAKLPHFSRYAIGME